MRKTCNPGLVKKNLYIVNRNNNILHFALLFIFQITILNAQNFWQDKQVYTVGTEPHACTHFSYPDVASAIKEDYKSSPDFKSLNGIWKFHWVESPNDKPKDFHLPTYDDSAWGKYATTVSDMFVPYMAPQECGARTDTRWLALSFKGSKNPALTMKSETPFIFSSLHYDARDLDKALRPAFLKKRKETILCLDAEMLGLGNASCGPIPLKRFWVPVKDYEFSFTLHF